MHSSRSEKPNSGTKKSMGRVGRYLLDMNGSAKWMNDQETSNEKEKTHSYVSTIKISLYLLE